MTESAFPEAVSPFGLIGHVFPFTMCAKTERTGELHQLSLPSSWITPARVGRVTTPGWVPLQFQDRYVDTFVLPISHRMGLPPFEVAALLRVILRTLLRRRSRAVLWVPVFAPARWFRREVCTAVRTELQNLCDRVAITDGRLPRYGDFGFPPFGAAMPAAPEVGEQPDILALPRKERLALLSLGRLRTAFTKEVNAHVPVSYRWMCTLMERLAAAGYIERTRRHS